MIIAQAAFLVTCDFQTVPFGEVLMSSRQAALWAGSLLTTWVKNW